MKLSAVPYCMHLIKQVACVLAGCNHDGTMAECTAYFNIGRAASTFVWNDALYYFFENEGTSLYKCNLNGSARQEVLTFQMEQLSKTEFLSPVVASTCFDGSTLYILVYDYVTVIDSKTGATDENADEPLMGYKIIALDLNTNEQSLFYETEKMYSMNFYMYGVSKGELYCSFSGQSKQYHFESLDDKLAALSDENSDYNKTFLRKAFTVNISDKSTTEIEADGIYVSKADAYFYNSTGVYSADGEKILDDYKVKLFACAEGLIYSLDGKTYLYSNNQAKEIGNDDGYNIVSESENYLILWSPDGNSVYCTKTSYYDGKPDYKSLEV